MRLRDKVAVVTGVSPNIGGSIAEMFAAEGAKVVCVDLDPNNAHDCAAAITKSGGAALAAPCNGGVESEVVGVVEAAVKEFGHVDALVNGITKFNMKGIRTMSVEEFRAQIDVILCSTFLFTKHVSAAMIDAGRGGSIIHLTSTEAHQGNPQNVAYCTAKAGLLNMARANAMELAPFKIRVNTLTPTSTDPSESVDRAERWGRPRFDVSNSIALKRGKLLPLGRAVMPREYAYAAVFLASDESQSVTGSDLRVDGGAVAKYWGMAAASA